MSIVAIIIIEHQVYGTNCTLRVPVPGLDEGGGRR